MILILSKKKQANELINGKCNSILIPTNKQMKLSFHGNLILVT